MLPVWVQMVLGASALILAIGVIWGKVIRPAAKLITTTEEMLPLLRELTTEFKNSPHAFAVLDEIVAQFRTDSGSSLRDAVNRLDAAAVESKAAAESLKIGVETVRQLAELDRAQIQRLIILLDRLAIRVDAGTAASTRIEQHAVGVAEDLAAAHRRANAVEPGDHGAAADAAAQLTDKEKEKEKS